MEAYKFPTIRLPGRNLILAGHGQVNGIDHHAIPRRLCGGRWRRYATRRIQETLVVARIVLLMKPGREAEIRQLDMPILVDQDIIRLDISIWR